MPWTLFDYLYRDAGNFKAFGCVALTGSVSTADLERILSTLENGEYFIAEQVGVPPMNERLYQWSNGPTHSDHCWHEFVGLRESDACPTDCIDGGAADNFVQRFTSVQEWNLALSPLA